MRCPLCGEVLNQITSTHLKYKHNMTRQEFVKLVPQAKVDTICTRTFSESQYDRDKEWLKKRYYLPKDA